MKDILDWVSKNVNLSFGNNDSSKKNFPNDFNFKQGSNVIERSSNKICQINNII